ncbi:alpha-hydroxy-acid oxidizing protein [Aestuariicella hydrocarbonica]|uniref:Alpha-hydroxy-acid oxidizing protein n=1 Tax=Pseudomaricurvus hydrocarbonicus TaxID=1470433 RepID=A0A9E5MKM9_9GAMM|nr:alpha-hydroxy acid oxidase [Aestuariicella hydrocarbonica]NHO66774.1 alpha-hydroxy-acid oxidizing protein [Aestuariicella hydrocarbonica]
MSKLSKCNNLYDIRRLAKYKLPAPMFHYIDGGSDDEWTLKRNTAAFDDYQLMPQYLKDVSSIDLSNRVLGCDMDLPFFLSPTGMSRLFNHEKEPAACRAAHKFGTLYSLSTLATTSLEDIANTSEGSRMFQIYILKDRELTKEFVQRCKDSKYHALCLTVDTMVAGNRERDLVNGMTMPPKITTVSNFFSYASSVEWWFNMMLDPDFKLANVAHRVDALGGGSMGLIDYINSQFDRSVTWEDAAWLAEQWDGPLVIKGIQSPQDAKRALEIGATAIMISNHGGRQLESSPAPVDCVAPMRDAIGDQLELIVDGGIRRGNHILKALAQGADACSIGRGYLFGLAAGGQAGVERSLTILKTELERSMALLGVKNISEINESHIFDLKRLATHR